MSNPEEERPATAGIDRQAELIKLCYRDAVERLHRDAVGHGVLREDDQINLSGLSLYSWPQVWWEESCGFTEGHLSLTRAQTVVVLSHLLDQAVVYHNGRFAYLVSRPNEAFYSGLTQHRFPGALEGPGLIERKD
jgi:hypothetical protein